MLESICMDSLRALCKDRGFARAFVCGYARFVYDLSLISIYVLCTDCVREQCPKGMLTTLRIQILREDASRGAHNTLEHYLYCRSALVQACCGSTD